MIQIATHVGEWETWHTLYLGSEEASRLFLSANEHAQCWRRNGGDWQRCSGESYRVLRPEVNEWIRSVAGYGHGEVWECDRTYYPHETLPELPKSGGRAAWLERFVCYPDRDLTYSGYGWDAGKSLDCIDRKWVRAHVGFQEGRAFPGHEAEHLPVILSMKFL